MRERIVKLNNNGIGILEILIAVVIISVCIILVSRGQITGWKRTSGLNKITTVCQIIEKQIESRRINISIDPETNYTKFKSITDTTIIDSTLKPPINVHWKIKTAKDRDGVDIENVRDVTLTAVWGEKDTLVVRTCIAKNF